MPIKFRCEHCRQFLGISHTKAGTLVDCPQCGRTIRVPDPEGKVQPLPDLKLNLEDSKLASALDELAMLGRHDTAAGELESAVAVAEGEGNTPKPLTVGGANVAAAAPIRIEPVVAAKPIPIQVPDPRQPAPVATMKELAALASLPSHDPATEQPVVDIAMPLAQKDLAQATLKRGGLSWIVIASLLGFIAGFVIGRWDHSSGAALKSQPTDGAKPIAAMRPSSGDPFLSNPSAVAVRGRITFQAESGELRPDRGARVLLLPETRTGKRKLDITGFRSGDADADAQDAAASLRRLGGDVAIVDEGGNFESTSLKPGTYRILALSHFQPRDDRASVEASVKALLDNFFDKPEQLLGKCRYQVGELKVSGQTPALWDHSFERD